MGCLFCKIIKKEIKAEIIYEDNEAIAFLDNSPRAPGHTMVLPKQHAETILELDDNLIRPVFHAVKITASFIKKTLKPDGFTIGINHGKASGQVIDHLHIHIIPRWQNDGGSSIHNVVDNQPRESIEEIGRKIRAIEEKIDNK
ncbi:MAG: HIT family protein [Patescibacteria group bacterium]